jgi:hypothetical protein
MVRFKEEDEQGFVRLLLSWQGRLATSPWLGNSGFTPSLAL